MNKKLIFVLILLIILITFNFYFINAENTKNSVIAKKNDNIEYIILRPPWDFTKYYLHPSTYDNHKEGTKDKAVDFYFKPDYNKPNIYIYEREGESGIEVLSSNKGKVYINLYVQFTKNENEYQGGKWDDIQIIKQNDNLLSINKFPEGSFKFKKDNKIYYIDMELFVEDESSNLRTYYVHLKIDPKFFEYIKEKIKSKIIECFINNGKFSNLQNYIKIYTEKDINSGEILGTIDKFGNADKPHLHFEVWTKTDNYSISAISLNKIKFKYTDQYYEKIFENEEKKTINNKNYYFYPSMPRKYQLFISSNFTSQIKGYPLTITAKVVDFKNQGIPNVKIYCDDPIMQQCGIFGITNIDGTITKTYITSIIEPGIYTFKFYSNITNEIFYTINIKNYYSLYNTNNTKICNSNDNEIILPNIKITLGSYSNLTEDNIIYSKKCGSVPRPNSNQMRDSLFTNILPFLDDWMKNFNKNPANNVAVALAITACVSEPVSIPISCPAAVIMAIKAGIKNTIITYGNRIIDNSNLSNEEKNNIKLFLSTQTTLLSLITLDPDSVIAPLGVIGSSWSAVQSIVEYKKDDFGKIISLILIGITKNDGPPNSVIGIRAISTTSNISTQITTLSNNTPIPNLSDSKDGKKYFKITVPSGSSKLVIKTSGGSGDVDLYVKYGSIPDLNNYDKRPYLNGNDELVEINNPQLGDWYIMLHGYKAYSGVTLVAYYSSTTNYGIMSVSPPSWSPTVNSGTSTYQTFNVSASNGNLVKVTIEKIEGPNWLTISNVDLGDIISGTNKTFNLIISPPIGLSGNYRYKVGVKCLYGTPTNIDITGNINVVSQNQIQITTLSNNTPIPNLSDSKDGKKYFKITVPSGSSKLVIKTSGGSGDVDLYVKYGSIPDLNNYDKRPYLNGNDELVEINNPQLGDWYIMLHGYKAYSGVTLVAYYSSTTNVTLGQVQLLSPANGVTLPPGNITFKWSSVNNATKYEFILYNHLGQIALDTTTTNLYITVTLNIEETVTWKVRAGDNSGNWGPWSNIWSVIIKSNVTLGQVQLLSPANGVTLPPGNITFKWSSVNNATKYEFILYNHLGQIALDTTTTNLYITVTLNIEETVTWKVRAGDNSGNWGPWSNIWSVIIKSNVTPNVTLTLYIHENSVNGPILAGARVTGKDGGGNYFDQTTNSNGYVKITGAPGNWTFTASKSGYKTTTWNQDITTDCEKHGYLVKDVQITKPSPPQNLTAEVVYDKTTRKAGIKISWSPPSNDGGSSIIKYKVYRKEENGSYVFIKDIDSQDIYFRDWGVTLGKKYFYKVTAVNSAGESEPSNEKDIYVGVLVKTTANLNVRSSPSLNGSIIITLPPNYYGLVVGGPIFADNYWWWYCLWVYNNNTYYGWSVENYLWFYSGNLNKILYINKNFIIITYILNKKSRDFLCYNNKITLSDILF
ncbi:MAG: pre-peptidase C-terminal domain-containing protein [Caldisericia bacterium]|nr:pre-peptidase C-terminal domain-containing protein [Caldisericia bacterium]